MQARRVVGCLKRPPLRGGKRTPINAQSSYNGIAAANRAGSSRSLCRRLRCGDAGNRGWCFTSGAEGWNHCRSAAPSWTAPCPTSSTGGEGGSPPPPGPPPRPRPSAKGRAKPGTNALIIEEILKATAPSAVRPAEIRKALQDKGVAISFPSIHHALRQLEARNAAEQVDDSKSWRHRGAAA